MVWVEMQAVDVDERNLEIGEGAGVRGVFAIGQLIVRRERISIKGDPRAGKSPDVRIVEIGQCEILRETASQRDEAAQPAAWGLDHERGRLREVGPSKSG